MTDITLDVDVLMFGCDSAAQESATCFLLMHELASKNGVSLVVDDADDIINEYSRKLKNDDYGQWWLRSISGSGKFRKVPRARMSKRARIKLLDELHFDRHDLNRYVRTAASSESRVLVSLDDDYPGQVVAAIRDYFDVSVKPPAGGHAHVCGCPLAQCLSSLPYRGLTRRAAPIPTHTVGRRGVTRFKSK